MCCKTDTPLNTRTAVITYEKCYINHQLTAVDIVLYPNQINNARMLTDNDGWPIGLTLHIPKVFYTIKVAYKHSM